MRSTQIKEFSMSGTLGDAFVVYCKLYDYWRRTKDKIGLYRYSAHINFDKPISEFFKNIPFVKYLTPCKYRNKPINRESVLVAPYINTTWHGYTRARVDPQEIKMDPYPKVFINPKRREAQRKFKIGIQYRCGRGGKQSNRRGVSLKWIRDLRKVLPEAKYTIHLYGKLVEEEDEKRIKDFCRECHIVNFVNQTGFTDWLCMLLGLDFFISFEGFPAYFVMSQKIPSLVFVIVASVLQRMHPAWKEGNNVVKIKHPLKYRLLRRSPHYSPETYPMNVNFAKEIIKKEYAKKNR